jgi:hypothetical protein
MSINLQPFRPSPYTFEDAVVLFIECANDNIRGCRAGKWDHVLGTWGLPKTRRGFINQCYYEIATAKHRTYKVYEGLPEIHIKHKGRWYMNEEEKDSGLPIYLRCMGTNDVFESFDHFVNVNQAKGLIHPHNLKETLHHVRLFFEQHPDWVLHAL